MSSLELNILSYGLFSGSLFIEKPWYFQRLEPLLYKFFTKQNTDLRSYTAFFLVYMGIHRQSFANLVLSAKSHAKVNNAGDVPS